MSRTPARLLALASLLTASNAYSQGGPFEGHRVVRVAPRTAAELLACSTIATNVWSCRVGVGPIDLQVTPQQQAALEQLGLACEVRIENLQALVDQEQAQITQAHLERDASWFVTYRTLDEINSRMEALAATSDGLATTFSIGNSIEGRQIRGIRFTGPDLPGNPRAGRPAALFAGGIHAREWVSPMTAMYVADRMLEQHPTDPAIAALLSEVEIIVIPVQNADGYAYTWANSANRFWRKNRRNNGGGSFGVDLNRNFGFHWGEAGADSTPTSDIYRGTGPFSEPETQVFRDFVIANPTIRAHVDLHSYTQVVMTPWGYTGSPTPDAELFDKLSDDMVAAIRSIHGMIYTNGPSFSSVYPTSGTTSDWTYGDRNIIGLGIELRDRGQFGFALPAAQILPTAEENFAALLVHANVLRVPLILSTPNAAVTTLRDGETADLRLNLREGTSTLGAAAPRVMWRTDPNAEFSPLEMTGASPWWQASLSLSPCLEPAEWYFEVASADGRITRLPSQAPAERFTIVANGALVVFADDVEADRGWTVGGSGETATAGRWERADPEQTTAQPGDDTTPDGNMCWVTGAAGGLPGANDVDGGTTILLSPTIDTRLPRGFRHVATRLAGWFWFSNNIGGAGGDPMSIEVSFDDGATWRFLSTMTTSQSPWRPFSFRIDTLAGSSTALTRVRFRISDFGTDTVVEGAVDDVHVVMDGCRTADFNGDSGIDSDDVIAYFSAWDNGEIDTDFTNDGGVDGDDVILFFSLWDAGR